MLPIHTIQIDSKSSTQNHCDRKQQFTCPRTFRATHATPDWVVIIIYIHGDHDSRLTTHLRPDLIAILRTSSCPTSPAPAISINFILREFMSCADDRRGILYLFTKGFTRRRIGGNNELRLAALVARLLII